MENLRFLVKRSEGEMRQALSRGVQRLLSMQTSEGALGFWPGARRPDLWGSAYGGMALVMADQLGIEVPQAAMDRLWRYLASQLRGLPSEKDGTTVATLTLALHTLALAERAEPGYHEKLYERRADLPVEARYLLASAIRHSASNAAGMVQTLLSMPETSADQTKTHYWFPRTYRDALALVAWSAWKPEDDRTLEYLERLLKARGRSGHWGATYTNAWALRALVSYAEAQRHRPPAGAVTVRVGSAERTVVLAPTGGGETVTFPWPRGSAETALRVRPEGEGRVYVEMELATRGDSMPEPLTDRGFRVERRYEKRLPDGRFEALTGRPGVGDLVCVRLHVANTHPTRYVVVDDPLPSVMEAVNVEFATQGVAGLNEAGESGHWRTDFHELRDDRALFFCDDLDQTGAFELRYWARVTSEGEVVAPPTKVEAMYDPSRYALGGTQAWNSLPEKAQ